MILEEAQFLTVLTLVTPEGEKKKEEVTAKEAEVVAEQVIVCPHCAVPGSKPVLDTKENGETSDFMVCNICGCTWPNEEDDDYDDMSDLEEALDLLITCAGIFKELLPRHNVMKKLGRNKEKEIVALKADIDTFLEQFPWKEGD